MSYLVCSSCVVVRVNVSKSDKIMELHDNRPGLGFGTWINRGVARRNL